MNSSRGSAPITSASSNSVMLQEFGLGDRICNQYLLTYNILFGIRWFVCQLNPIEYKLAFPLHYSALTLNDSEIAICSTNVYLFGNETEIDNAKGIVRPRLFCDGQLQRDSCPGNPSAHGKSLVPRRSPLSL